MGNCLRRDSAMQWGGDDWASSPVSGPFFSTNTRNINNNNDYEFNQEKERKNEEEKGLLGGSKSSKEVKIKISKKQLAELLGRVDMNELSVEQVLAQLMNITDGFESDHRAWKPNLQSIPE